MVLIIVIYVKTIATLVCKQINSFPFKNEINN